MESAAQRRLACCASEPPCVLCPLLPANAHRSLKELALAGLKANLKEAGVRAPQAAEGKASSAEREAERAAPPAGSGGNASAGASEDRRT